MYMKQTEIQGGYAGKKGSTSRYNENLMKSRVILIVIFFFAKHGKKNRISSFAKKPHRQKLF